jgi:DNA-directed RNA polymerase omega subunit
MQVPLENMLDKCEGSVYKLVILAAKRALELAENKPRLIDVSAAIKPTTVALMEIAAGKVVVKKEKSK